jgi:hypothetical protein
MSDSVVSHAKNLEFICELTVSDRWQLFSPNLKETWRLSQLEKENRWLLSLDNK